MTNEPSWLRRAAQRATIEPWSLGRLFAQFCEFESISDEDLAGELRCAPETLRWLYLCRTPSSARFADDIQLISQRFALDGQRLAALIRRADALVALRASADDSRAAELLLAARDREDREDQR